MKYSLQTTIEKEQCAGTDKINRSNPLSIEMFLIMQGVIMKTEQPE